MFPRYLQYLLTDFRQTFVTGASRDRDELIRFWGQKVKGQGHSMTEYIPDFYVSAVSSVSVVGFPPNLSLVHLGTQMTWLRFGVERSKVKVTPSRRRRTALDATVECNFFCLLMILFSVYNIITQCLHQTVLYNFCTTVTVIMVWNLQADNWDASVRSLPVWWIRLCQSQSGPLLTRQIWYRLWFQDHLEGCFVILHGKWCNGMLLFRCRNRPL